MSFNGQLLATGGVAQCLTDSVQVFGADGTYSSNVALYQLDSDGGTTNNVPDTTGNYNGTATNVTYATGYIGNAAVFNGSSSKITLPTGSPFNDSNTIKAVSVWVKADTSTSRVFPLSISSTSNLSDYWYIGYMGDLNAIYVATRDGSSSNQSVAYATITPDTNWHHLVVQITATEKEIYLDGVKQTITNSNSGTGTNTSWISYPSYSGTVQGVIGILRLSSPQYSDGSIDQVRIFDKSISAEDVATLYAETSSTASNTNPFNEGAGLALYTLDYDGSDAGGLYDGTPTNVEFGVGGQINYGARFNGSSSKIDLGNNFNLTEGTGFSISMWVKPNSLASTFSLMSKDLSGTGNRNWSFSSFTGDESTPRFFIKSTTGSQIDQEFTSQLVVGTWTHLVVTWNGGLNATDIKLYFNSSIQIDNSTPTGSSSIPDVNTTTTTTLIGDSNNYANHFNGSIDQVRIFSKALDQSEINTLYAETACVYTCTTDTVNYPTGTTPVAYYKLDNSAEDETGVYDGTSTDVNYAFGRFNQAAVFNGSSSRIDLPNVLSGFTNVYTFSIWAKIDNTNNFPFFSSTASTAQSTYNNLIRFALHQNGDYYFSFGDIYGARLTGTSPSSWRDGNWHNFVFVSTSTEKLAYVDGSLFDSTSSTKAVSGLTNIILGFYGTNYAGGSMDQVRIYSTALDSDQVADLYNEKPCADTSTFKTVLYEGTGATQYISNVGMDLETRGGLVWIKNRDTVADPDLIDSVRGATKVIESSNTLAEFTEAGNLQSFEANGFFVGNVARVNKLNSDIVAWVWKGGGDAVQNTQGSITSDVSANTAAGFSIVKYIGNGLSSEQTVGHGLDYPPELVIIKDLDNVRDWYVYTDIIDGSMDVLYLNKTDAKVNSSRTSPTSNVYKIAGNTTLNKSNQNFISYCFHSVAGYSAIGTYTGSNPTKVTVNLGFEPSWIMIKSTSNSYGWYMLDNKRSPTGNWDDYLYANSSGAEGTSGGNWIKAISTGFETNPSGGSVTNQNGVDYLYMAFK